MSNFHWMKNNLNICQVYPESNLIYGMNVSSHIYIYKKVTSKRLKSLVNLVSINIYYMSPWFSSRDDGFYFEQNVLQLFKGCLSVG